MTTDTLPNPSQELRAAKRKNRELRQLREARRIEDANHLLESIGMGGIVDWTASYYQMLDRFNQASSGGYMGATNINDRRWGRAWPIFVNEIDLQVARMPSRILTATNSYAIGLLEGWTSYIGGEGFVKNVQAKPGKEDQVPKEILAKLQAVIEDFAMRNQWDGAEQPGLEEELIQRPEIDGEFFLCLYEDDSAVTRVCTIEPEQVTAPNGADMDYLFGVRTSQGNPQDPISYWIRGWNTDLHGEEYDAEQIVHFKTNVQRQMKRGFPTFSFSMSDTLTLANDLRQSLGVGAKVQAGIAMVRQWETANQEQVTNFTGRFADYTQTLPNGQTMPVTISRPGTTEDIPKGMSYAEPPNAKNGNAHIAILQACLRGAAARYNAPEWMGSADSSNNTFSSGVVADSMFGRRVIREQSRFKHTFHRIFWWALDTRCKRAGIISAVGEDGKVYQMAWEDLKKLVELKIEPSSVETRNKLEEAQRVTLLVDKKLMSPQQGMRELGEDVEDTIEQIKAWSEQMGPAGNPVAPPGAPQDDPNNPGGGGGEGKTPDYKRSQSAKAAWAKRSSGTTEKPPTAGGALRESADPKSAYTLITDAAQLAQVEQALLTAPIVGLDIETTGLDPDTARVRLLSLAVGNDVFLIDCFKVNPSPLWARLAAVELAIHYAPFDLSFLAKLGFSPGIVKDTCGLARVLSPVESNTLAACVQREMGQTLNKDLQTSDWSGELTPEQLQYAATDAAVLVPLAAILEVKLRTAGSVRESAEIAGYGSKCPTCGEPCVGRCRCMRADSHCKNGHGWHVCTVHGTLVLGQSDHAKSGCTCSPGQIRESADWDESRVKRADDGKFGSGGGSAKKDDKPAKPKHGERAASANSKYHELIAQAKQHRIEAFNAVKADAEESNAKAVEATKEIHINDVAWDTDDDTDEPFAELESAIGDYDNDASASERYSQLKEIEEKAKEALAVKQAVRGEDYDEKESLRTAALQAMFDVRDEFMKTKPSKEAARAMIDKANAKLEAAGNPHGLTQQASGAPDIAYDYDELPKGVAPEEIATNKAKLKSIIANAREARKHLKTYVQHRKEMQSIKSGELTESREQMVDDGANVDWVQLLESWDESKVKRADDGKFGSGGGSPAKAAHAKNQERQKGGKPAPPEPKPAPAKEPEAKPAEPAKKEDAPKPADKHAHGKPASGKAGTAAAIAGALGVSAAIYHTLHEAGSEVFHSLPESVQAVVTKSVAVAFSGWTASQSLAERISKEKGSTPDEAAALRSTLAAWDLVAFKPMSIATAPLGGTIAAATWIVPPITGLYLLHATVRHPIATFLAATGLVKDVAGAAKQWVDDHTDTIESKEASPTAPQQALVDALERNGYDAWYTAILHAALAETKLAGQAVKVADAVFAKHPKDESKPQDGDADALFGKKE